MAKPGKGTVSKGPIATPFKDCVVPPPGTKSSWGGEKDGTSIPGGRKGTGGIMPEVTTVDVGGKKPGSKASAAKVANRS